MIEIEAPEEFVCPLTLDVMRDPVMSRYGQSFERSEILQWLRAGHGVCPLSRRPLSLQDLVTNHALKTKIAEWRKENGQDNVVVVSPSSNQQIYGFITLPLKEDNTDRTLDEEDDLYFLHLAANVAVMEHERQQQQQQQHGNGADGRRRRRHQRRRASTGSFPSSSRQDPQQPRHRAIHPLRGLRNFFAAGSANHS